MPDASTSELRLHPYGEWVVRFRWPIIVVALLFSIAAASGLARLTVNPDSRVFFDADNPDRQALDALEATYAKDNNVLIVIAPHRGTVFTPRTLALVKSLTDRAWKTPFSRRVDSLTNFQYSYAQGDDLVIRDLVPDPRKLKPPDIVKVMSVALHRPETVGRIVSRDGRVTAVNITTVMPGKSRTEVPKVAAFARQLIADAHRHYPDHDFHLTGGVMIDMAFAEAAQSDSETLVPLMLGLIMVVVGIALRSWSATALTLGIIVMSVATSLGLTGWAGLSLNAGTSASPVIIMTLSVANCVHILTTFQQQIRAGQSRHGAVVESLRVNLTPVAITSLTTAVGFLTLNFSESLPLRELGDIVSIGMTVAFVCAVTFLPAVMSLLPERAPRQRLWVAGVIDRLADFVIRRNRLLLIASSLAIIASVGGISRIVLDDDFIRYFDGRFAFRVDTDFTQNHLTGLHALEFSLPAGEDEGIARPDYLAKLDAFATWLRAQPEVVHVSTVVDTFKRLNQNLHGDDPAYYRIPVDREHAAQYLMLYEMSVPFGMDLNSRIDVAKSASRVTASLSHVTSQDIRAVAARAEAWLHDNAPAMQTRATGMSMAFARISERNILAMLKGTGLALVLISFILLVVLRSPRIGLISLAPNLIPAAVAFGLWGYLFGQVNLAIAVVVAMTLGIVVDDTVHFLSKYLRGRREHGMTVEDAVRHGFRTVGGAMTITSAALVLGFGALALSGFAVNGDMGLLSAITIALALLADVLFLPPLLILFDRRDA